MSGRIIKLKQVGALKKCINLQCLINEAYKILGNPVILYDVDWKILAYAQGVVTDDPIWNNHVNDGTVDRNIETFINAGFIDIITRRDKAVLLDSEHVKYARIFGKIFDKDGNIMAGISIVACDKPFEDGDLALTEAICKVLSPELLKNPYYRDFANMKLETYINMLIDNELNDINDRLYILGFVEMVYKGLKNNLYLAAADIDAQASDHVKLKLYKDLFKRTRPTFKYSIYSNYIVIVIGTDESSLDYKKTFRRLYRIFEQDNIRVGVSSRFENLFDLRKYFQEAVCVLKYGCATENNQRVFMYDECIQGTRHEGTL